MLIVPELETVFILVPRTGSGTLYREVQRVYPRAMLLYRHMEADGCPQGYDRWRRIGFVRHPLKRLESLYNLMHDIACGIGDNKGDEQQCRAGRQVLGRTFEEWLLHNDEAWTAPLDTHYPAAWWPLLSRRAAAPENRISQFQYLRPDLGVEVRKYETLRESLVEWGLNPERVVNRVKTDKIDVHSHKVFEHFERHCAWDLEQGCEYV